MELVERRHIQNVSQAERIASIIAGGALGVFGIREGLKHHSIPGAGLALAGAALVKRGITGYCDLYRTFGVNTTQQRPGAGAASSNACIPYQQGIRVERSITINASREAVYSFWRNLENLPRFMKHVQCVRKVDDKHSHWMVEGPAGQTVEWDAEIINEIPNELLAWRSLPGASVDNAGSVRFEHATAGRGTKVTISLQYDPPAGQIGVMIAKLFFGKEPERDVDIELHRLKSIMEAGEIATSQGQPAGRVEDHSQQAMKNAAKQAEEVHDASEASFPASDPPSYSHVVTH
jgi:uncharacterized membrane protein